MIRVLNVQNASVEVQYRANIASNTVTMALLTGGRRNVATTTPRQTISGGSSSTAQVSQATATPVIQQASPTPPVPPQNIRTGTVDGTSVVLTWASAGQRMSYRVYYNTEADDTHATIAGNANGTTYTITNLQRKTLYYFWVTTMQGNLESAKSESVFATTTNTYKIGDIGPGGGIVFAVGGSLTPSGDIVFTLGGNTNWEVSPLLGNVNYSDAVWSAQNYRGGGYNDWHLPGSEVLNLIYENLQRSGKANLGSGGYWSSGGYWGRGHNYKSFSNGQWHQSDWGFGGRGLIQNVRAVRSFTVE